MHHVELDLAGGELPVGERCSVVCGVGWGATATGSPWLCDHLWEHYAYTRDKEFLKWAYPIMKGSAEFFLDMLITDPKTVPDATKKKLELLVGKYLS